MLNSGRSPELLAPTVTEVRPPAPRLRPRHWPPRVSSPKYVRVRVSHSVVSDSATPWTVARQAPLSMGILQTRILERAAIPSSRGSS